MFLSRLGKLLLAFVALTMVSLTSFGARQIFRLAAGPLNQPKLVELATSHTALKLDSAAVLRLWEDNLTKLSLELPTDQGTKELVLWQVDLFGGRGFSVQSPNGPLNTVKPGRYYHGYIKGTKDGYAAVSIFQNQVIAVINDGENGDVNIGTVPNGDKLVTWDYALIEQSKVKVQNSFECGADELTSPIDVDHEAAMAIDKIKMQAMPQVGGSCRLIMSNFEADNAMYAVFGRNATTTTNFVTGFFNVVKLLYSREFVDIGMLPLFIWTTPDPYNAPAASASNIVLGSFRSAVGGNTQGGRQLNHLLSINNRGHGGIASLDVLCNSQSNVAYSGINSTFSQFPTYSWTVNVVAHEMGHNFGSRHTHNCNWPIGPGNTRGAIDSCYQAEGNCFTATRPRPGTVMSYCHLTNRGVDLNLGFGPLPRAVLVDGADGATCAAGIFMPPVDATVSQGLCPGNTATFRAVPLVTPNSNISLVQYRWRGPNGFNRVTNNTTLSFTVSNIQAANQGWYYLETVGKNTTDSCFSPIDSVRLALSCLLPTIAGTTSLCGGTPIPVTYTAPPGLVAGNRFLFYLSDSAGNFVNRTKIDSVAGVASGVRNVILPSSFPSSAFYRLQIETTNPRNIGEPSVLGEIVLAGKTSKSDIVITGDTTCGSGQVRLEARSRSGQGSFAWSTDSLGINIQSRNPVFTPNISATTKFYVSYNGPSVATIGPRDTTIGWSPAANNLGRRFTVSNSIKLDTVVIYSPSRSGSIRVDILRVGTSAPLNQNTVALNASRTGIIKVALNGGSGFPLSQGDYILRLNLISGAQTRTEPAANNLASQSLLPGFVQLLESGSVLNGNLTANPNIMLGIYRWSFSYQACPSSPFPVVATVKPGLPAPTISNLRPLSFCQGDSVVLEATNGLGTYEWSNGATGNRLVVKSSATIRALYRTASCASDSSNVLRVEMVPTPGAPIVQVQGRNEVCQGDSIVAAIFQPVAGVTYRWANGTVGTRVVTRRTDTLRAFVQVTNLNCTSPLSTPVIVRVNARPAKPQIVFNGAFDSLIASVPGGALYIWLRNGQSVGQISRSISLRPAQAGPGTYRVLVINPGVSQCRSDTSDPFLVTSTQALLATRPAVQVFPQPAHYEVTVSLSGGQVLEQVQLINVVGQVVRQAQVQADSWTTSVADLPKGQYFLKVKYAEGQLARKMLIGN